jgi:hypothetical protein
MSAAKEVRASRITTRAQQSRIPVRRGSFLPGEMPETSGDDTRLYSDVAASRSASPRGETVNDDPASAPEELIKPVTDYRGDSEESSEEEVPLKNVIRAKRAKSLDSIKQNENTIQLSTITTVQLEEQQEIIQAAEESLTTEERDRIQRRQDAVDAHEKSKGKTVDPREWGNVEFNEEEMDPETQEAILNKNTITIVIVFLKWEGQRKAPSRRNRKMSPIRITTIKHRN